MPLCSGLISGGVRGAEGLTDSEIDTQKIEQKIMIHSIKIEGIYS